MSSSEVVPLSWTVRRLSEGVFGSLIMPPASCLTRLSVLVEPAEGQASGGAWPASAAAVLFRRPRPG